MIRASVLILLLSPAGCSSHPCDEDDDEMPVLTSTSVMVGVCPLSVMAEPRLDATPAFCLHPIKPRLLQ